MSSDISRQRFDPKNDFSGVLMQQGRVQLDADWNEWNEILDRHWRSETMDIIGRCVVPRETPDGFAIAISGAMLTIGRGRIYVDGLQAENHGAGNLEFDAILSESRRLEPIPYDQQPNFPNADPLPAGGPHLIYVDVWEREVTAIEDPHLIENAVGVDTTSRLQTVWQVRVLSDVGAGATCATRDDQLQGWLDVIRPSAGRLTTKAVGLATTADPCLIPPSGGYRGLGNRTYRVEIHDEGVVGPPNTPGKATFKWSRDNASIATDISAINAARDELTVQSVGRDSVLRFKPGDWVEITDDWREFSLQPGEIRRIATAVDASRTITLATPLTAGLFAANTQDLTKRHTRIKRWDQSGIVRDSAGATFFDLDAAVGGGVTPGVIPVPAAGTSLILEDGVKVTFTTDPDGGEFRSGDYWVFVARTADASVEELDAAPPRGVHHHYGRLALVTFPNAVVDCRIFWPPSFPEAAESCDCTVCVSADQHNTGVFAIHAAVNQLRETGGTICLGPGTFNLVDKPVELNKAFAVRIRGQGLATIIVQASDNAAFIINDSVSCTLDYLTIFMITPSTGSGDASISTEIGPSARAVAVSAGARAVAAPAIRLSGMSSHTTIERVNVAFPIGEDTPLSVGILLETGTLVSTKIRDNNIVLAHYGVGFAIDPEDKDPLVLTDFYCEKNFLVCFNTGIHLAGNCTYNHTVIAHNFIEIVAIKDGAGIRASGTATGGLELIANTIMPSSSAKAVNEWDGIVVGTVGETRICDNRIGIVSNGIRNGILFVKNPLLSGFWLGPVVVSGNWLDELSENGIKIDPAVSLSSALIESNVLNMIGEKGIFMGTESRAGSLKILGNELTSIGVNGTEKEIAGIYLKSVGEGEVSNNSILGVGTNSQGALVISGVRVDGRCFAMRISENTIMNIAPASNYRAAGAGIFVASEIDNIEISDNLIRGQSSEPSDPSTPWQAIHINQIEFGPLPAKQADIHGNSLHGYTAESMVEVFVSGCCRFSDNHCSVPGGNTRFAVELTGDSIIASGNRVECITSIVALVLQGGSTAVPRAYTVLGNITGGEIYVGNAILGTPWSPLNVKA